MDAHLQAPVPVIPSEKHPAHIEWDTEYVSKVTGKFRRKEKSFSLKVTELKFLDLPVRS
jgi:hypothetical protein